MIRIRQMIPRFSDGLDLAQLPNGVDEDVLAVVYRDFAKGIVLDGVPVTEISTEMSGSSGFSHEHNYSIFFYSAKVKALFGKVQHVNVIGYVEDGRIITKRISDLEMSEALSDPNNLDFLKFWKILDD